jgi:hypothetical protein
VSEERLHDVDGFTTPHEMHRHRVPEGVRSRPTRQGHAGTSEPAAHQMVERCRSERPGMAVEPRHVVAPRRARVRSSRLARYASTAVTTSGGSGQSRTAPPLPLTRT